MQIGFKDNVMLDIVDGITGEDYKYKCGVYRFDSVSASGKTRLYKLLASLSEYDKSVLAYSYNDVIRECTDGKDFLDSFEYNKQVKVVMLDRVDLYYPKIIRFIQSYEDKLMILTDCKSSSLSRRERLCDIKVVSNNKCKITVY